MPLALAFVDVNHLKRVNDEQGHLAGDGLLKHVAGTLRRKLRPYDVIVRFGGDEFVCALANMHGDDVQHRFADIIQTLEANGFPAPISYGIADLQKGDDLERLLARADIDLIETRRISRRTENGQAETQPRPRPAGSGAEHPAGVAHHLRVLGPRLPPVLSEASKRRASVWERSHDIQCFADEQGSFRSPRRPARDDPDRLSGGYRRGR